MIAPATMRSRVVAAAPNWASRGHSGLLISGVLMSAMRIFSPWYQNVSPSTTQLIRTPPPQIEKRALSVSGATGPVRSAMASAGGGPPHCSNVRLLEPDRLTLLGDQHDFAVAGRHPDPGQFVAIVEPDRD